MAAVFVSLLALSAFAAAETFNGPALTHSVYGDRAIDYIHEARDNGPIRVYPIQPRYIEWSFDNRYTIALLKPKCNKKCGWQFRWQTDYCGSVNRTIAADQDSFSFTFAELAADFSREHCRYTTKEIKMLANSPTNDIIVENLAMSEKSHHLLGRFPILDDLTRADIGRERCDAVQSRCGSAKPKKQEESKVSQWPPTPIGFIVVCFFLSMFSAMLPAKSKPNKNDGTKPNEQESTNTTDDKTEPTEKDAATSTGYEKEKTSLT